MSHRSSVHAAVSRFLRASGARHQRDAFEHADPVHFAWQTRSTYVSERERELVARAFLPLGSRVLDVGCGEGATLANLGEPPGAVGVDLVEEKLRFAREALPGCRFVLGSALSLPFSDGAFDHLVVRDVVHHVAEPELMLAECERVLVPGGRLDVLEPCRYNPLILAHALWTPTERGELCSTKRWLAALVSRRFDLLRVEPLQALPLHRLALHPKLGLPALAERSWVRAALARSEHWAELLLPRFAWAYVHVRARRR